MTCSQCSRETALVPVRLFGLGIKRVCQECATWYMKMGAQIDILADEDERQENLGVAARAGNGIHLLRRRSGEWR